MRRTRTNTAPLCHSDFFNVAACRAGLRIEIQIRSRLQHAWATAVETVDAFSGTSLKTTGGSGSEKTDWGRFYCFR